jgi:hypothetical protein
MRQCIPPDGAGNTRRSRVRLVDLNGFEQKFVVPLVRSVLDAAKKPVGRAFGVATIERAHRHRAFLGADVVAHEHLIPDRDPLGMRLSAAGVERFVGKSVHQTSPRCFGVTFYLEHHAR